MLKIYNTISRKKEKFKSIHDGKVNLYTCGPTVYDYAHIGNFRAYMFEDLLRRALEYFEYDVLHVMNITDIDDKTIKKSINENKSLEDITSFYTDCFFKDVETLNILPAHHYPKATSFVDEMIEMIETLIDKGNAYSTRDGSVFFKISSFSNYGKLAKLNPDDMVSGERVDSDEYEKQEVRDFALWKSYKEEDGDIFWNSPWGKGRPGWHIECSCMSGHYLGDRFDIHCGGVDNIFPHHENEIAQSECYYGKKFVNYWMHNEHLKVEGEKMSKSKGNFYTIRDLIEEKNFSPSAIRYTLLSTHYRQRLNFTFEKINSSQKAINRLRELVRRLNDINNDNGDSFIDDTNKMLDSFSKYLSDDLNISGALGELFSWANIMFSKIDSNLLSKKGADLALNSIDKVDLVIGCINNIELISNDIKNLIKDREQAREDKDWVLSDNIRKELLDKGIHIEDTPTGTIWKKK